MDTTLDIPTTTVYAPQLVPSYLKHVVSNRSSQSAQVAIDTILSGLREPEDVDLEGLTTARMIPKPFEDQKDTALACFGAPQFAPSFIHVPLRYGASRFR